MEDIGLIQWKKANTPARDSIHLYRIPTKASAVIVKYRPSIAISCVIPPQKFSAAYRLGGRGSRRRGVEEITTPILLMTQSISELPTQYRKEGVTESFSLWALKLNGGGMEKTQQMCTSPYLFGNVWAAGSICFGGMSPLSLKQAFNYYWASGFNDELFRERRGHVCNNKRHVYRSDHTGCLCKKKLDHQCSCVRKTTHKHSGCGCTTVVASRKCRSTCLNELVNTLPELRDLYKILKVTFATQGFPEKWWDGEDTQPSAVLWQHWKTMLQDIRVNDRSPYGTRARTQNFHKGHCVCCLSIATMQDAANREAMIKGKTLGPRQLARHAVVDNTPYPGCGCGWRHKNTCPCKTNSCSCPCLCECCTKTCGHEPCSCRCCRGVCNCPCSCTVEVRFKEHLSIYHDKVLPKQVWKDRTTLFCGDAYWASPKSSSAILVTNHPYVLMNIPEKYRRKMSSGFGLIALGRENGEVWEFESGTYRFQVPNSLVTAN